MPNSSLRQTLLGVTKATMQVIRSIAIVTLGVSALLGCTAGPVVVADPSKLLIGCWEGKDFQPVLGQTAQWMMQRRSDGSFEIEFRSTGRRPQREAGKWKVEGNTYTTMTLTINGSPVDVRDPQFTDVYELRDLTADSMAYFHAKANVTFRSIKVACPGGA